LQFLNVSNLVADHISAEWTSNNLVSVLNSSNVTVQWSILAQSLFNSNNLTPIASLLQGGSGYISFNHNLYADNNSGSPLFGDDISLDFVNNVIYDWGTNAGFSPNNSLSFPGAFTNYLNYDCNYLIASSNAVMNTIAFYGGSTNTWIFQTNNLIDSNTNGILDGANTKWNMFTNLFTPVGHSFPLIPVPTDEAYLAYEKVLDFAGVNMALRDSVDTNVIGNVRSQTGTLISAPGISPLPQSNPVYLDTDQDGIPDFWQITFGHSPYVPSNNNPSANALGYTMLEEYDNWLAAPHAVTLTNTPVGVDLQQLFGEVGHLSFFVTNAIHGSVYLTNVLGSVTNTGPFSNSIAVFVPTNTTPAFTNYASFDAYVTNNDTLAYFGPVTVSVMVSGVPVQLNSNIPPVIISLATFARSASASAAAFANTNYGGSDYYVFDVTNNAGVSPVAVLFTVTNATGPVDLVANYDYGPQQQLPSLSYYEFISTNSWTNSENILISSNSTPVTVTNGNWYLAVVNVAGSNVSYTINATEFFSLSPPVFTSPADGQQFTNVATFPFTYNAVATDPNTPALPLTFALASGPTNLTVSSSGLINWTPTLAQGPTTNGPSTNTIAVSVSNGDYFVTNTFTIIVTGTNIPPILPNQPNEVVIVPGGTLVVTNTAINPNLPDYPLTYGLTSAPPGALIDSNGIITWSPTLLQAGSTFVITTVVTDTNPWAVNATSLSATNSFTVIVETGIIPGTPQTNTIPAGGFTWLAVPVPANAVIATNTLLFATNLPVNLWFSTNLPPTIINPGDVELLANSSGGSRLVYTNGSPAFVPGETYFLGVQNPNAVSVTYALNVGFGLVTTASGSVTNYPFSGIVHTNIGGTNGYLLTWFAPSNDLFTVQWTTTLPSANWTSFTNLVSYNPAFPATLTRAQFNFFDDGSQDGGLALNHFYRLILLGQPSTTNTLTLPAQPNLLVGSQTALSATNTATDSDPYAVLTYSLLTAPAGAVISSNGIITWTAPAGVASTNVFTTLVTDNGSPSGSASNTFFVIVQPAPAISEQFTGGGLELTWFAPSNDLYEVEWRTNLTSGPWTLFPGTVSYNPAAFTSPTHTQFNYFDNGSLSGPFSIPHYYKLILLPQVLTSVLALPAQSDIVVGPQTTLSFTNTATDSNPYAVPTYSLLAAPAGATIDANGIITWTTPAGNPTTNTFTTVATDNGSPAATATNTFIVIVRPAPGISNEQFTGGSLLLTWFAPSNELFQVEWRTNLTSGPWTVFAPVVSYNPAAFTSPTHTQFNFTDDGSQSGPFSIPHYYKLILLPSDVSLGYVAGPVITRVTVAPSGTTLQWLAPTNEMFKVQWTTDLVPTIIWTPFTNIITSATGAFSFTDTNAPLMMKFYELLLLP
jgi:hypothetical protein